MADRIGKEREGLAFGAADNNMVTQQQKQNQPTCFPLSQSVSQSVLFGQNWAHACRSQWSKLEETKHILSCFCVPTESERGRT